MRRMMLFMGLAALALTGCSDPQSIVVPHASHTAYEYTRAEVTAAGGWLAIAELEYDDNDTGTFPGVFVWGGETVEPEGADPYTAWTQLGYDQYQFVNGQLRIFVDDTTAEYFRVVISRSSTNMG